MPTRIGTLVQSERLVTKLLQSRARVVELIAPAGFGKTSLANALGEAVGTHGTIAPTGENLVISLETHAHSEFVAIFEDVDGIPESQIAAVASAIELASPNVRIVLCSRRSTKLHRGLMIPPNERIVLTAEDLAFRPHEALRLFENMGLDEAPLTAMIEYCGGWPAAVLSLRSNLEVDPDIRAIANGRLRSLNAYLLEHVLGTLTIEQRDALLLCSGMPGLRREQLVKALEKPSSAFDLVDLQLAEHDAFGGIVVRQLLQGLAYRSLRAEMQAVLSTAAVRLGSNGMTAYAAAAHLAAGDVPAANEALSASAAHPKQLTAFPYHAISAETRRELDAGAIKAYPELWVALFVERQFQDAPTALLSDARQIAAMLPHSPLRNAVLSMGALLAVQSGRIDVAYELLQITTPSGGDSDDALLLKSAQAMLDAHLGHAREACALWLSIRKHFWGYHAWCTYMMLVELKAARVDNDPSGAAAVAQRMWETAQNSGSSLLQGYAAAMNAFTAWLYHDDSRFAAHLERLRRILTLAPSVHLKPLADALAGTATHDEMEAYPLYNGLAKLVAAASAPLGDALEFSRKAIEIGDACEDFALRILSRIALSRLEPERRPELEANCRAISGGETMRFLDGLQAFAARYDRARHAVETAAGAPLRIEIATGTIYRGERPVSVSLKSSELLFALAANGRPVSRDALFEYLWSDQTPDDARSVLKMCVHRARQQVADQDAIVVNRGAYALGPHVVTDTGQLFGDEEPAEPERLFRALSAGRPAHFTAWEWFGAFETRLIAKTAKIGLELASRALARGDVEGALHVTSVLTNLDPCDETATELAIRAHLHRGERSEAVSRYRTLFRSLKDELGVEPSDVLRALIAPAQR